MKSLLARVCVLGLALTGALALPAAPAQACGGFFCSSTPVDQNAERIVFKVRDDGRTDMIVQITYQGKAEDFAWLLPLSDPPGKEDLGTFSQLALTSLDAQTGVVVRPNCFFPQASAGAVADEDSAGGARGVQVYVRTQVGNYDVAVIGSDDAQASADWLEQNDFRISEAMLGFIKLYTAEGMKFLALKLLPGKALNDITPFKLTLPGATPSIPLRLSAVAAEPEMGVVVWIFGNQRYEPANAEELTIDDRDLRFDMNRYQSNWTTLVARAVDAAQGKGFVVENAQPIDDLRQFAQTSFANTADQQAAQKALIELFANVRYMTRLYTRISPEEMTYDPIFKRSNKGDVSRFRTLPDDAGTQCTMPPPGDPCDFVACGALGLCRTVERDNQKVAACACADGATARATFVPDPSGGASFLSTVSCVDQRLSFLNPGDRNAAGEALPDPCVGIDCGGHGKCVPMNMTPTCECERGYVAEGVVGADNSRSARCLKPTLNVPNTFYNRRALARDPSLPIGRDVAIEGPSGGSDADDPVPEGNANAVRKGDAGCSVAPGSKRASDAALALLSLLGLAFVGSRRRARQSR